MRGPATAPRAPTRTLEDLIEVSLTVRVIDQRTEVQPVQYAGHKRGATIDHELITLLDLA
jgi:hypothetical protein